MIEGLEEAIRRTGAILAEHAPPRLDDVDELPNKVILLRLEPPRPAFAAPRMMPGRAASVLCRSTT